MKLSKVERLALINQYKILDMVDNSNDHAEKIDILKNGYVYLYSKVFEYISDDQDICSCEFYYNVLNMHNRLGIEFAGIPIEDDNFDYVCHLLEYKFVKVKGAPRFFGNRVPNYQNMYATYFGIVSDVHWGGDFSKEHKQEVLAAGLV